MLSKALGIAGHAAASSAVAGTVMGRRVSRFKDVAEASLEYLNRKVEEAKSNQTDLVVLSDSTKGIDKWHYTSFGTGCGKP